MHASSNTRPRPYGPSAILCALLLLSCGGDAPPPSSGPTAVLTSNVQTAGFAHAMAYDQVRNRLVALVHTDEAGSPFYEQRADGLQAQWVRVDAEGAPSVRGRRNDLVYDSRRARMLFVGGVETGRNAVPRTYEWDGQTWKQRDAIGPRSVDAHALAYDPVSGKTLLFGGVAFSEALNETWQWNGNNWTQRKPSQSPPPIPGKMAYHPIRDSILLALDGGATWEWDGADWEELSPGGGPPVAMGLVFDVSRQTMVAIGNDPPEGVTRTMAWEWNGGGWDKHVPSRFLQIDTYGAVAYDSHRGEVVVSDGSHSWTWNGQSFADASLGRPGFALQNPRVAAWDSKQQRAIALASPAAEFDRLDTWSLSDGNWYRLDLESGPPVGEERMVYDSNRELMLAMVLAYAEDYTHFEFWAFDGTSWEQVPGADLPPPRHNFALAYDPVGERTLLFGGWSQEDEYKNDLWAFDGTAWSEIPTQNTPVPTGLPAMDVDPTSGRLHVFIGSDTGAGELWTLTGDTWTEQSPGLAPEGRSLGELYYDTVRESVLLVPGKYAGGVYQYAQYDGTTWSKFEPTEGQELIQGTAFFDRDQGYIGVLNYEGTFQVTPQLWWRLPTNAERVYEEFALATDHRRGRTVLFGGLAGGNALSNTTYERVADQWRLQALDVSPSPRTQAAMIFDAGSEAVFLFGGRGQDQEVFSDNWLYDEDGWRLVSTEQSPPARHGHALAYSPVLDGVLLFGGLDADGKALSDTWLWDGEEWKELSPAQSPTARFHHAMTYDPTSRSVLLYGGAEEGVHIVTDFWTWDGSSWQLLDAQPAPGHRRLHGLVPDPSRGRVLLAGGDTAGVWSWDGASWEILAEVDPATTGPTSMGSKLQTPFYDAFDDALTLVGSELLSVHWRLSPAGERSCIVGQDLDGDGRTGCADRACEAICLPLCPDGSCTTGCGDGTCSDAENPRLCPADCGEPETACGDNHCQAGEDNLSCPGDCR